MDTWLKLHVHLIAVILRLNRTFEGCKKIFKKDKLVNRISRLDCHACKFYDSLVQLWHQIGTVIKHVTTSVNDYVSVKNSITYNKNDLYSKYTPIPVTMATPNSTIKVDKRNFQERCYGVFVQMAENN